MVELLRPYLVAREEMKIIPSRSKGDYTTVPQLAEYLQISKRTIFSWIYQRKIPYSKIGRRVVFKREDIEQWCEGKKVKASYERGTATGPQKR